jgi:hypothetical protein
MNTIIVEGVSIKIPTSKIRMHNLIGDKIIVCLDEDFPYKCLVSLDLEIRKKYVEIAWIMTSGIWCFDLKGTFLWKSPEVVDRNKLNLQVEDMEMNFHGSVYVQFRYDQQGHSIIANTSHGHIVTIDLATGKTISIVQGK